MKDRLGHTLAPYKLQESVNMYPSKTIWMHQLAIYKTHAHTQGERERELKQSRGNIWTFDEEDAMTHALYINIKT